ncbi:MAG: D-alanyl-D-alanine carboxypeptidase [Solirubrobacteraceae bacterium]|nr:D-alanyl-D-alanine carboxypeptidase [Solirubrobacteraceae bacterium]
MSRRRPSRSAPVAVAVAALVAAGAGGAAAPDAADAAMPSTSGIGSRSGVMVRDLRTGEVLLSRHGDVRRIPASVTKVFTVVAAARELGPEWRPRTRVVATGARSGSAWKGDLYLVGGGDPTLSRAGLTTLAATTAKALGAKRLSGRLYSDATAFDSWQGGHRTRKRVDFDMGGRLGALTSDRGSGESDTARRSLSVFRTALQRAGLRVGSKLAARRSPTTATPVSALPGTPVATLASSILGPSDNFQAEMLLKDLASRDGVEGACRLDAGLPPTPGTPTPAPEPTPTPTPAPTPSPVPTPTAPGGAAGGGATPTAAGDPAAPTTADEPATTPAAPEDPATACAKEGAGARAASTARGISVLRRSIRGLIGSTPQLHDGSGLTRSNRVSPAQVTRLLVRANDDEVLGPLLRAALPQAGRSGTLAGRMRGTAAVGRCQAKTGTINGVSALAGYCRTRRGRDVAFAILQNGGNVGAARAFQDRFVARLAHAG